MKRILLVDDSKEVLSTYKAMLEIEGYTVDTALNGEAALVLVGQHPLDLLITDFDMGPGMKGDELSREVRKKFSSLRIIMVTGSEVPASYPHPSMQKGVRREDFIAEVKYWLNN